MESSIKHGTFVITRHYSKAARQVFAAFADPAKKRRWFLDGPNNHVDEFEMNFQVGGIERARYRHRAGTPVAGIPFVNEGRYLHIQADQLVVTASTMSLGGQPISHSLNTFELLPLGSDRTELTFTFQGVFLEGSDGPERREAGWNTLLERLECELAPAQLVS